MATPPQRHVTIRELDRTDQSDYVRRLEVEVEALRRRVRELEMTALLATFGVKASER